MFADVAIKHPLFPGAFLGPGKTVRFSGVSMKNFMKATKKERKCSLNSMNSSCLQQDIEISFLNSQCSNRTPFVFQNGEDNDFAVYLSFLRNMT